MALSTAPQPLADVEIYDFEAQFDAAFALAVANFMGGVPAAKQQDAGKLITPRVETKFVSGQQEQRDYIVPGTGNAANNYQDCWRYQNLWSGSLFAKIVTNRIKEKNSDSPSHGRIRAEVRRLGTNFGATLCPNLKFINIVQLTESGGSPQFEAANDEDVSSIVWAIKFNIRSAAFPVPS